MSDFPEVKDHLVANPDKYTMTTNPDGTVTLRPTWVDNPAEVLQEGTPVDAAFLSKIPEAIDAIDEKVTSQLAENASETKRLKEVILPHQRNNTFVVDVDVNEAYAERVPTYLAIPTYVEKDDKVVHPSVLVIPEGWNGWTHWMAMTPYTDQSFVYENPSIVVSNDGINWVVPAGLTNPVFPKPTVGYFADTVIFLDPDFKTMHMVWKLAASEKVLLLSSSVDGINWSAPVSILTTATEEVSPAIIWLGDKWCMWTVSKNVSTSQYELRRRFSDDLLTWTSFEVCTVTPSPAGNQIWHIDIVKLQNQYHMLAQYSADPGGGSGDLYFAKSNDGLNWTIGSAPVMKADPILPSWDRYFYKSALVPKIKNGEFYYGLYYGTMSQPYIGYTELKFIKSKMDELEIQRKKDIKFELMSGILGVDSNIVLVDLFNRADNATSLGTASTGQTWTNTISTIGVSGNRAKVSAAGNARAIINTGQANFEAHIDFVTLGTTAWFMFRYTDATNLWRVGLTGGRVTLEKIISGSRSVVGTYTLMYAGDRIGVKCVGDAITIYQNGKQIAAITSADSMGGTSVGLNVDNVDSSFDNLIVKKV